MKTTNTSFERIDALVELSDATYDAIDQMHDGEPTYRSILRTGIGAVAHGLNRFSTDQVGASYRRYLQETLVARGFSSKDMWYDTWDTPVNSGPLETHHDQALDELACKYADTTRVTVDRESRLETDARHAVHLGILAVAYATYEYPELDANRIALYTLIHDIPEAYAGDIATLGASQKALQAKSATEAAALARIAEEFGDNYPGLIALIDEYEELETPEAKFVKSFDKLDPSFSLIYTDGTQLIDVYGFMTADEYRRAIFSTTDRMSVYAESFPKVVSDKLAFTERIASITYPSDESTPH